MNKFSNEEKLLLLMTIYKDNIVEKYLGDIEYDKLSEEKLLTTLKNDNYKVRSLLIYNLKKYKLFDKMPAAVKEFFTCEEMKARENFYKKKEEIKYIKKMFGEKYSFLVLKGVGMAETVYKEVPYIRDFNDIDLLVNKNEADEIYHYLQSEVGYICKKSIGEQRIYKKFFQHYAPICREGIYVEMHHRLTQENDPYNIDTERIIKNAKKIMLDDIYIDIPDSVDMLINLCYHLYQHEYREARFMLKPYADIYNFLFNYKNEFEWIDFMKYTKEDDLLFPITYSLYFANSLYKEMFGIDIVPQWVLTLLMPNDFMEKKDAIVSRHLFNNDEIIGVWSNSHIERMFLETKILRQEICKKYFFYESEKKWKEKCTKMGITFEENFEFSPRAWEKYGRI